MGFAFFLITVFLNSAHLDAATAEKIAQDLRELIRLGYSGDIHWDSTLHAHRYPDDSTRKFVQNLSDVLVQQPDVFKRGIQELSSDERETLVTESKGSLNYPIDLISIQLKLRLEKKWEEHFQSESVNEENGFYFPYDRSELWSLSKHRLRLLFKPDMKLSRGYALFREAEPSSNEVILACVDEPSMPAQEKKQLEIGGIFLQRIRIPKADGLNWKCLEKTFLLERRDFSLSEKLPSPLEGTWDWNREQIRILSVIGLMDTISADKLRATEAFLKWRGGFRKIGHSAPVDLKENLQEYLLEADIFIPFSSIHHANHFQQAPSALEGQHLEFYRKIQNPRYPDRTIEVHFDVLLPPPLDEKQNFKYSKDEGTSLNSEELAKIWRKRAEQNVSQLYLIELACFAAHYIGAWMSSYREFARQHPRVAKQSPVPWIYASQQGHQAQRSVEVMMQMDIVLYALGEIFAGKDGERVLSALNETTLLNQFLSWVSRPLEWFGVKVLRPPDSFDVMANFQDPYDLYLESLEDFDLIAAKTVGGDEAVALYPPLPRGARLAHSMEASEKK